MILQTPIFHNKNIKIDGKDIYYDARFRKGVRFINDLIKENGAFLDQAEYFEIFRIQTNYLQFWGITGAINTYLKDIDTTLTHRSQTPFMPSHIAPIIKSKQGARVMYIIFKPQ